MKTNKQKNSRKRLNSLILLVAFTAVMLIVSTYAWFSTQKDVTLSNLTGIVKVAESLEISLDAKNWTQVIDFSKITPEQLKKQYGSTEHNVVPSELIPVSTDGADSIGKTEMALYRGINTETKKLDTIQEVEGVGSTKKPDDNQFPGYYAIDLFLRNSGIKEGDIQGTTKETLQLTKNSSITVLKTGKDGTTIAKYEKSGLQNTPRVAFAMYQEVADVAEGDQDTIISDLTTGNTISDVAIWEPNSNAHVSYITTNYNKLTLNKADMDGYLPGKGTETPASSGKYPVTYAGTDVLPTYALTADSKGKTYADLYDWTGTNVGLSKQISLQTTNEPTTVVNNLISVTSDETSIMPTKPRDAEEVTEFKMLKNSILRVRMYIWLEGQDPDCVNYASHGGGIEINLGLCKGAKAGSLS